MEKISLKLKDICVIILLFLIGIVIFSFGFLKYGNTAMEIQEYVFDWTLSSGSNSKLESNMFWIVLFGGIIILVLSYILKKKNRVQESILTDNINSYVSRSIVLGVMCICMYIYNGYFSPPFVFLLCVTLLSTVFGKEYSEQLFFAYIFLSCDLFVISYLICKKTTNITLMMICSMAIIFLMFYYIKKEGKNFSHRLLLILQCILPLMLVVYLKNAYQYGEEVIFIKNSIQTIIFWVLAMVILVVIAIRFAYVNWNNCKIGENIGLVSCISIASISSFSDISRVVYDSHHLAEEVILFNQVVEHHMIPYVNYFPVSGVFPIVIGGIQELLGMDLTGTNMAISVFNFFVLILAVILGSKYIGKRNMFFVAALFPLANAYIRPNLILLYILILLLPSLREKSGYWLEAWIAMTYLGVFFYPVFGVASLVGILPLGLIQTVNFFRKRHFKEYFHKKIFILILILEIIIIAISIPSIWGVISHTLVYSHNSILSNAWPAFGQMVPDGFLGWLGDVPGIRTVLWYSIRYMLSILVIWILVLFSIKFVKGNKIYYVLEKFDGVYWAFSGMMILIVSSTLTTKRQDEGSLLTRNGFIIFPAVSIIICIILYKYINKNYISMMILGILCSICALGSTNSLNAVTSVFNKIQNVSPDIYYYISEEEAKQYNNLGAGFIPVYMDEILVKHKQYSEELLNYDNSLSFIGIDLGYLTALNIKSSGQPSIGAVMTYKQTEAEIKQIRKNKPVIFTSWISSTINYNLYKWLVTSDEYIYSAKYEAYLPKELAEEIGIVEDNRVSSISICTDVGNNAATAGRSFETLRDNYFETDIGITINQSIEWSEIINEESDEVINYSSIDIQFDRTMSGLEGDYLYIDLNRSYGNISNLNEITDVFQKYATKEQINENCYVKVSWEGEKDTDNYINCQLSDGRLYIPLGANINWLLNQHNGFKITVSGLKTGERISINNCKILKSKDL